MITIQVMLEFLETSVGRAYGYGLTAFLRLDDPHRDALALRQICQLRPLDNRDMDEDVLAAIVDFDEAHALFKREPFDGAEHLHGGREDGRASSASRMPAGRRMARRRGRRNTVVDPEYLGVLPAIFFFHHTYAKL